MAKSILRVANTAIAIPSLAKFYLDGIGLTGDTYLVESSANVLDFYAGGAKTLSLSATGAAVVGTLSATGAFASTSTGAIYSTGGATLLSRYAEFVSTNGGVRVGLESDAGGAIFTGSSTNAGVIGTVNSANLQFATNATVRATLSTTGLAITGTLSAISTVSATNSVTVTGASNASAYLNLQSGAGGGSPYEFIVFKNSSGTQQSQILGYDGNGLYLDTITGLSVYQRVNSVAITAASSTGLAITGTLSASGASSSTGVYSFGSASNYGRRLLATTFPTIYENNTEGAYYLGVGAKHFGAGTWTPDSTSAAMLIAEGAGWSWYTNTGLTGGVNFSNTLRMNLSSTGLAVNGTLSATDQITLTKAGTAYMFLENTGNGKVFLGAQTGENVLVSRNSADAARDLQVVVGATAVGTFSSTGLAVTGTLSATGTTTLGDGAADKLSVIGGGGSTSTIQLVGGNSNDNATISSQYNLSFQVDNTGLVGGRTFDWRNGGYGYSDGTPWMTLSSTALTLGTGVAMIVANTTDATSTTAASLKTAGGLAVAKKLYIGDSLILPKAAGKGIKIEGDTYTWRDLEGVIQPKVGGAGAPTWATWSGNVKEWKFIANDVIDLKFHWPHDHAPDTDIFIHIHWSHNGSAISGGSIVANYRWRWGKRDGAYSAERSLVHTVGSLTGKATLTGYVEEIQLSAAAPNTTPGSYQIDTQDLEPDGLLKMSVIVTGIPTVTAGDFFIEYIDIHYQSTNIGTKNKASNFYA